MKEDIRVTLIGIGTLGGFLARSISELDFVKELTIFDGDIVSGNDDEKGIYKREDFGLYKVGAITKYLYPRNNINFIKGFYYNGDKRVDPNSIIIDSSNRKEKRTDIIDYRININGRVLLIDTKKIEREDREEKGFYSIEITKEEIRRAAYLATEIIFNEKEIVEKVRDDGCVLSFDLNFISEAINLSLKNNNTFMLQKYNREKDENFIPLREKFAKKETEIISPTTNEIVKLKPGEIKTYQDIENIVNRFPSVMENKNYFMVISDTSQRTITIRIIEESGGS